MSGSTSKTTAGGRVVRKTLDIDAPVGAVLKALSDDRELSRWFPMETRTRRDGAIEFSWGEAFKGTVRIEVDEPNTTVRQLSVFEDGAAHPPIVVEFALEARGGGGTTLRLVNSGFGEGAEWDEEYDSVNCGWDFELRGLKHYMENHLGVDRRAVLVRGLIGARSSQEAHRAVMAALELPISVRTGDTAKGALEGIPLEGPVVLHKPDRQFAMRVKGLNDAMLRVEHETCDGRPAIWVFCSTYGLDADRVSSLERLMIDCVTGALSTSTESHVSSLR